MEGLSNHILIGLKPKEKNISVKSMNISIQIFQDYSTKPESTCRDMP